MPITIETFAEFSARHGGDGIEIGHRLVFSDGAECDTETGDQRREPFDNPLHARRRYLQEKLRREVEDFQQYKAAVVNQASLSARFGNLPPPADEAADDLKRGRERIHALREQIRAIDEQLEESPAAQRARADAQREEERRRQAAAVIDQIRGIDID